MIRKKAKPPATQRSFATPWGELDYLCKKISYWLYCQPNRDRAERYEGRLERVLRQVPDDELAIVREEGLALVCELQGRIGDAIMHRKREIQLMERLQAEAGSPQYSDKTRAYMLRDRNGAALAERRDILDALVHSQLRQNRIGRSSS